MATADTLLRRLEWTVLRRLDGLLQGDYRTLWRGFGMDLADLREYQAHDDVRHIDWNVTARLDAPHVREFQEDREVSAWFVLDLTGSVDFSSQSRRKSELAAEFTGVLARLLTRHGNRVGALLSRDHDAASAVVLPAGSGRRHVLHLLNRVLTASVRSPARAGHLTDLGALLRRAQQTIKRRSVVFVVSDFISVPGWGRALQLLSQRHDVVAVRLVDPLERALPDLGFVMLEDAETAEQLLLDTHDRAFRQRFLAASEQRESALRTVLAEAGVDCLELTTNGVLELALVQFIALRKRRSQLAAGGVPRSGMAARAMA